MTVGRMSFDADDIDNLTLGGSFETTIVSNGVGSRPESDDSTALTLVLLFVASRDGSCFGNWNSLAVQQFARYVSCDRNCQFDVLSVELALTESQLVLFFNHRERQLQLPNRNKGIRRVPSIERLYNGPSCRGRRWRRDGLRTLGRTVLCR